MKLKSTIKLVGGLAMTGLGLPPLLHRTIFSDQFTIVTYHAIVREPLEVENWCFMDVANFRAQMRYLKRHFRVVRFSEAIELLRDGRIDRPTATITFDDGFHNNYDVAFPILRELNMPAIIFLTTGLLDSDDMLWFCRLNQAMTRTARREFDWSGQQFNLALPGGKTGALEVIGQMLIRLPHSQLLSETRKIVLALGGDPDQTVELTSPYGMLSYEAIDRMSASGLIEFGAHTHSHAILSRLSSEERRREIESSVQAVTALTGHPCEFFAYPNGQKQDYNNETISLLRACGIKAAVTSQVGPSKVGDDLLTLRRYGFGVDDKLVDFQVGAHHIRFHIKRLLSM